MKMIVAVSKKNKKCNKPIYAKKKEIHHRNSMKHYSTIKNYNDYETVFILASKKDEKWHYAMNVILLKYSCRQHTRMKASVVNGGNDDEYFSFKIFL